MGHAGAGGSAVAVGERGDLDSDGDYFVFELSGGDTGESFLVGHSAGQNHVVNFAWLEVGNPGERLLDGKGGEIVGARGAQRAFVSTANGSADGGDDHGFGHGGTSQVESSIVLLVRSQGNATLG